jgi:hypothetical protein
VNERGKLTLFRLLSQYRRGNEASRVETCSAEVKQLGTVANLTEWDKKYSGQMPLVLTPNATGYAQEFTRARLLSSFGQLGVAVGTPESIARGEHSTQDSAFTLSEFAAEMRETDFAAAMSVYDEGFFDSAKRLRRALPFPLSSFNSSSETTNQFVAALTLGADSTSVVFQYSEDKYVDLMHGQKLWFLFPPKTSPPPRYSLPGGMQRWVSEEYFKMEENKKPLECIQHPGQVMYIPEGWHHASMSIGESVAVVHRSRTSRAQEIQFRSFVREKRAAGQLDDAIDIGFKSTTMSYNSFILINFESYI